MGCGCGEQSSDPPLTSGDLIERFVVETPTGETAGFARYRDAVTYQREMGGSLRAK